MLATRPKAIMGATSPIAMAVLPARFSGGPNERRTVLRIRKESRTSRTIGNSGGAFTSAEMLPVSNAAGKNRAASIASFRGLRAGLDGSVARKFAGILLAAAVKTRTAKKLDRMIAGPAQ